MANYATLKAAIAAVIKTNGNKEITGAILQQTLVAIVNALGSGYQFIGKATPETTPGTPDQRVFYIGASGTYPNFGPAVIPDGNLAIFYYDSAWHYDSVAFPLGDGAVTEPKLATALANKLFAEGYKFIGTATPSTNPGTPNQNVFYIASTAGTYPNFSSIVLEDGEVAFLKYNGAWSKELTGTASFGKVNQLEQEVLISKPHAGFGISLEVKSVSVLPSGYVRLKYIKSSGTQYINTGITSNDIIGFEIQFKSYNSIGATNYGCIFGGRKASGQYEFQLTTYVASGDTKKGNFCNRVAVQEGAPDANINISSINNCSWLNGVYSGNGSSVSSPKKNLTDSRALYLFALNNNGTAAQFSTMDLYSFKMYNSTGLIRNFIPCKNGSNVVGLYDTVTSTFYGNSGTGVFVAGEEEPETEAGTFINADSKIEDVDNSSDLEIADDEGNVLVQFKNGHIRTKNFNSEEIDEVQLPSYWKTYLDAKLSSIRSDYLAIGGNGVAFTFITDTHWDDNQKKSPLVIRYIQDKVGITDCIFGGDVVTAHGTRANKLTEIYDFMDAMQKVSPFVLVGNHDYNTSDQTTSQSTYLTDPNLISPGEFYRICNVPKEKVVRYTRVEVSGQFDEYFGYTDNESQKIRYIFLDSGAVYKPRWADTNLRLSNDQVNWMKDRITELPSGWGAIVFTHIFFNPASTPTVHGIGTQIETALDSIYDTINATIIGVVCGHVHTSYSKVSSKGYPIIATTTDSAGQSNSEGLTYTPGTTTEQAFDLFFINTINRTIKVTRIGAGDTTKDRTFNY